MRISDWSSDVCSSDLSEARASQHFHFQSDKAFFQRLHPCVGKGRIPPPQGIYGARMLADRAAGFAHIRCVRQHFQKQSFLLFCIAALRRSEEHTSELQSLMRISYAVFCLKKKTIKG